jgi:5-methylcytosine-specific restriction enzyme A
MTEQHSKKRNPPWTRDELILALDKYFYIHSSDNINKHQEAVKLSKTLNLLPIHDNTGVTGNFRNPDGVHMKWGNFQRLDPDYSGAGLTRGSKLEEVLWNEFFKDRKRLAKLAANIMSSVEDIPTRVKTVVNQDEEAEFPEGKILYRLHKYRERNSTEVKKKKRIALENNKLHCEICEFDFQKTYGELGVGYIECHHTLPISEYQEDTKTKPSDLILVCSNCHRMLHRRRPWLSKKQLTDLLKQNK